MKSVSINRFTCVLIACITIFCIYSCKDDAEVNYNTEPEPSTPELNTSSIRFLPNSPWYSNVQLFEKDEYSDIMIASLIEEQINPHYNGIAAFNYDKYNIPLYITKESDPVVDVIYNKPPSQIYIPDSIYNNEAYFKNVKVPSNIKPPLGNDSSVSIWDADTDTLWEFWRFEKKEGKYYASWGGRIDNVSKSIGVFPRPYGQTATGISSSATIIKGHELLVGLDSIKNNKRPTSTIAHAVSLAIIAPRSRNDFSWPANRSDGLAENTDNKFIREGQKIRLSKDVDVMNLDISNIAKVIAVAVQDYGFIVQDKAGAVAITTEGAQYYEGKDYNPWDKILIDDNGNEIPRYSILKNFPWDKCEVVKADAGK